MEALFHRSDLLLQRTPYEFHRSIPGKPNWEWRMNAVIGARGVGKTTLLLQRLRRLTDEGKKGIYVTLDDPYFTEKNIFSFAEQFTQEGGEYLLVDEVHKYPDWGRELKNIYDLLPDVKVVFSGSSVLDIHQQGGDLSRRALYYFLPGLSFREYLQIMNVATFPVFTLEDLLHDHRRIANEIVSKIKPILHFKAYLEGGYYPFFMDENRNYWLTLDQLIKLVIEVDMQFLSNIDPYQGRKMLQLLRIVSQTAPFKPNISKLSERIGVQRKTLLQYLHYLEKAKLIRLATLPENSISVLQKPDKIFLENPNLYIALAGDKADRGSLRETFFFNQLSVLHKIDLHRKVDFMVSDQYAFEIGGRNKSKSQIQGLKDAFVAADGIETGYGKTIPLWLFGFLY
jgi:predicted AAA+ superfamily ATPase